MSQPAVVALTLLMYCVCPLAVAAQSASSKPAVTFQWANPSSAVVTFTNNLADPMPFLLETGEVFESDFEFYQWFIYSGDEILMNLAPGESVQFELHLACAIRDGVHPSEIPDLAYSFSEDRDRHEIADVAKRIRDAWAALLSAGKLRTAEITEDMPKVLLQWAVWASTGTTRSDLEELVRSSIELDTEVDQIVAALASDIAVIGDTAGLPFEGWGDHPGPLAAGPVDVSQWAQVAFFAKAPGPKLKVTHIKFDHKDPDTDTSDGLNIRYRLKKDLKHRGKKRKGEWIRNVRSEPVLYVANKTVTIMVRFTAPRGTRTADIKARAENGRFRDVLTKTVNFDAQGVSTPEYVEFSFHGRTGNMIEKKTDSYNWIAVSINGVPQSGARFDQSGPHEIYTVIDVPHAPWYAGGVPNQEPWVDALKFVIKDAGTETKTDAVQAATQITTFLFSGFSLTYESKGGRGFYSANNAALLTALIKPHGNNKVVNCHDVAIAAHVLTNLVGGNSEYLYARKYGYLDRTALIGVTGTVNNPFLLFGAKHDTCLSLPAAAHGSCHDDIRWDVAPHNRSPFDSHGVMRLGGLIYDSTTGPHTGLAMPAYIQAAIDDSSARERTNNGPMPTAADFSVRTVTIK